MTELKTHSCGPSCSCRSLECKWTENDTRECYETECGHDFIAQKGIVEENKMEYCPFCRSKIVPTW